MNATLIKIVAAAVLMAPLSCSTKTKPKNDVIASDGTADQDVSLLQSNRYRGYDAVNHELGLRIFDDETFALAHYIEDTTDLGIFAAFVSTLKDLLGSYKGTGLTSGFRNGTPNSMNLTLWYMAFSGLATDVRGICQSEGGAVGPFKSRESFRAAAQPLCAWPLSGAARHEALHAYWSALMQLDGPEDEFAAWEKFATSNEMKTVVPDEAIFNLTFAALYNPHFLITK